MRFNILGDYTASSGVGIVLDNLTDKKYREFFQGKNYSQEIENITVVIMCQNPALELKQRIRFSKKEKKIYLDIMLDLSLISSMSYLQKETYIIERIVKEVPIIIEKYKIKDFNLVQFNTDLQEALSKWKFK
jgi:hypothetical protein